MLMIDSEKVRQTMFNLVIGVKELAEKTGLSQPTISKIAQIDKFCTIKTIGKLAKALKIDPDTIIKSEKE